MKFIKKLTALFLAVTVMTSVSACNSSPSSDALKIITTNFPPYDFVRQISEGTVTPKMLLSGGQDSHSFEPTAAQIIEISEADIFIYTGGESDAWVENILDSIESDVVFIRMMDYVEPLCSEEEHHHEEGEHHEHSHEEYDEHVWTSPKNAMEIANAISIAMNEADPDNITTYKNGFGTLYSELSALDKELSEAAENLSSPLIFGDRFPFLYMARDYGIEYYAAFSGCSSETEPSAAKMTELIEAAKKYNVSKIYHIEFSTEKVANTVAEAVGAETALFHSCHSVSDEDLKNGETYVSLMRKNIEAMK